MAVGHMVDHLPDRPAIRAVGGIQLGVRQRGYQFAEPAGKPVELTDPVVQHFRGDVIGGREAANGVAQRLHFLIGPVGLFCHVGRLWGPETLPGQKGQGIGHPAAVSKFKGN